MAEYCGNPECREPVDGTFYCEVCSDLECPACLELSMHVGHMIYCENNCELKWTDWDTLVLDESEYFDYKWQYKPKKLIRHFIETEQFARLNRCIDEVEPEKLPTKTIIEILTLTFDHKSKLKNRRWLRTKAKKHLVRRKEEVLLVKGT